MQILSMFVGLVIKEVILAPREEGFDLHFLQALIDPLATMGIGRVCLATQDCREENRHAIDRDI
jgi:Na+-transporting NADH:ubiquinone oxidoreductase subunit NqrD